jgi:hypothetical protein
MNDEAEATTVRMYVSVKLARKMQRHWLEREQGIASTESTLETGDKSVTMKLHLGSP